MLLGLWPLAEAPAWLQETGCSCNVRWVRQVGLLVGGSCAKLNQTWRVLAPFLSWSSAYVPTGARPRCFAALVAVGPRRQALTLLECDIAGPAMPNVRANRATTAGHQARRADDMPGRSAGLVACRWRSG